MNLPLSRMILVNFYEWKVRRLKRHKLSLFVSLCTFTTSSNVCTIVNIHVLLLNPLLTLMSRCLLPASVNHMNPEGKSPAIRDRDVRVTSFSLVITLVWRFLSLFLLPSRSTSWLTSADLLLIYISDKIHSYLWFHMIRPPNITTTMLLSVTLVYSYKQLPSFDWSDHICSTKQISSLVFQICSRSFHE